MLLDIGKQQSNVKSDINIYVIQYYKGLRTASTTANIIWNELKTKIIINSPRRTFIEHLNCKKKIKNLKQKYKENTNNKFEWR